MPVSLFGQLFLGRIGRQPMARRDFFNSLLAAFTPREIEAQLRQAGSSHLEVEVISDRHLIVYGRLAN
jgi:hypothetical protein